MTDWNNQLYFGDCLDVLQDLYAKYPDGLIDLIYIDPPFNSKRNYNILFEDIKFDDTQAQKQAFADTWSNVSYKDTLEQIKDIDLDLFYLLDNFDRIRIAKSAVAYLTTMAIRIWYMHKVLKPTGSFYLHCDPNMSHYLKLVLDMIFSKDNFRNEIVWHYKRWPAIQKNFQRMHDVIMFYSKTNKKNIFNLSLEPLSKGTLKRWKGKKSLVEFTGDKRLVTQKTDVDSQGRPIDDVWDIPVINSQAKERLGYPTQKPEALLERIIKASSNPGDLVADFFCGCGTTVTVAERLKRNWLGADISHLAIGLIEKRLLQTFGKPIKDTYDINGFPKDIASAKELAQGKGGRLKFQDWIIESKLGGVHNPKKTGDGGWDGHVTFQMDKKKEIILIEVKSGHVTVKNLREFIHVVTRQQAAIGVFICLEEQVTKPMQLEAKSQGYYNKEFFGNRYDKIQILTLEAILDGAEIQKPMSTQETFKTAKTAKPTADQKKLF